jgi:flagellar biosynthesis/type III secretory pathway M-ring protein FliF/YscJ
MSFFQKNKDILYIILKIVLVVIVLAVIVYIIIKIINSNKNKTDTSAVYNNVFPLVSFGDKNSTKNKKYRKCVADALINQFGYNKALDIVIHTQTQTDEFKQKYEKIKYKCQIKILI